jgi:hypothetical protein
MSQIKKKTTKKTGATASAAPARATEIKVAAPAVPTAAPRTEITIESAKSLVKPVMVSRSEPVVEKAPKATAPKREITTEVIAARAYTLWEQAGRPHGRDREYWLQAEAQLKQGAQSFTA